MTDDQEGGPAMADPTLQQLIDEVETIVAAGGTEEEITAKVAGKLTGWLAEGPAIDADYRRPDDDKYVLYPLHVDPEGRFSIASAVWNVGQSTPVHGHETWGVVGIYSGVEHEIAYAKPHSEGEKLVQVAESDWSSGRRDGLLHDRRRRPLGRLRRRRAVRRRPHLRHRHRQLAAPRLRPRRRLGELVQLEMVELAAAQRFPLRVILY